MVSLNILWPCGLLKEQISLKHKVDIYDEYLTFPTTVLPFEVAHQALNVSSMVSPVTETQQERTRYVTKILYFIQEIDLLKKRKEEIEKLADEEKAMLDAEIKRREELEEIQRNLQQLLEDQKRAREEDERIRAAKERLLEEERVKREQLEALRLQQQQELQNEKMQKEELMEKQKEQERILEEVKWKFFFCCRED